jgi:hypothetical protein
MKSMTQAAMLSLLVASSVAHSNELNTLLDASQAIVNQIDSGIKLAGAAIGYAPQGGQLSDGSLSGSTHISSDQLSAYNNALAGMQSYQAYGSVQDLLEEQATNELQLMDEAVGVFTGVVVEMLAVVEVAELAEAAETPDDQAQVQEYVVQNQQALTINQEQVETYNQSIDDIETHANAASAFLGVAANSEAVAFLQTGAEDNNANVNNSVLSYSASSQSVSIAWEGSNNATAVYVNGTNFGMDFYKTDAEILLAGAESDLYLTGPTYNGYRCFMYGEECES